MRLSQTRLHFCLIFLFIAHLTFCQQSNLVSNICPDQREETLLQSGTYTLTNPRSQNTRTHTFQITVNYAVPLTGFKIAISTSQILGYNQGYGTDYSIRASRLNQTNTAKVILFMNSDLSWTSVKVSYLIASRSDFFLGSFVTEAFDMLRSNNQSYLVEYTIPNWTFTNRKMKYVYLISGLKTADYFYNINLNQANFNNQDGAISMRITTNAIPSIEYVYITYLVFEQTTPFTFQFYNPLMGVLPSEYSLEGVDSINGNSIITEGYGLNFTGSVVRNLNCVGTNCPSQCISTNNCSARNGFIVSRSCFLCGANQFYSNSQCLPICSTNEILNNSVCVCRSGYTKVNGVCRIISCLTNQVFNGAECVCISGYRKINGVCQLDTTNCPVNSFFNGLECVCVSNYVKVNSRCLYQCIPNGYLSDSGVCLCLDGYSVINGQCQQTVSCTRSYEILVNNRCQCISGYQYNNLGNCVSIACNTNEQLVNGNCVCISGYQRNSQGFCVRNCGSNEYLLNDQCLCVQGYVRSSSGFCVPVSCRVNEILTNNSCVCRAGYVRNVNNDCVLGSTCRVNQVYDQNLRTCVCRQGYGINSTTNLCDVCPVNSYSSGLLTGCLCNTGYTWSSFLQKCVNVICPTGFILNQSATCVCPSDFYLENGQCKKIPTCPARATWNQTRLSCVCDSTSQYLINNTCQTCQANSGWNGTQCVCRSGFNLINGTCTQCSSNSNYVQGNCVCKFGYFGNGISCTACHSTCGTCFNQLSTSCLSCVNASYTLSNGICTLGLCDKGNFFNTTISRCEKCTQFCDFCTNKQTCQQCMDGFSKETGVVLGSVIQACVQTCGDGKRFYLECDDGNLINDDGCNVNCKVEVGWTCVGGSQTSRSSCTRAIPTASRLIPGGHVVLQGQVLQGISLTYIPQNLTNNGCPLCDGLLNVSILSSPMIPSITVDYIQATQYRFIIRFNFAGTLANFIFNYTVRINDRFRQYFTAEDMNQVQIIKIDMALLARYDQVPELSINNLNFETSTNSNGLNSNENIVIDGVPSNAVKLLFPQ